MQSLPLQTDSFDEVSSVFHSSSCTRITFQVMAVAGQSTRDEYAVSPILEGSQDMQHVHATAAQDLHDLQCRRVLDPQAACQICGVICAVGAAEGDDLRLKSGH